MALSERAVTNEPQLSVLDQRMVATPNRYHPHGVLKLGLQFLALASLTAACNGSEETVNSVPSGESVPVLTTTITPTTELAPTTSTTPTTEPILTTTPETTTSVAATETSEPEVNINNKALCEQARDPSTVLPGSGYDQAGVPNLFKLRFRGRCTGLPDDLDYGWVFPDGPGYIINPLDTTGFEYNSRGFHFSELPPVGSADITWDPKAKHPEYLQYGPLTLDDLVAMKSGDPFCSYIGTKKQYAEDAILSRVGLITYDNKYDSAGPDTYLGVFLLDPDGTENPVPWAAAGLGIVEYEFGGWSILWAAAGECKKLPTAP